jgi:photosystem II stability/assembly factor-like uncharacterized protein
MVGDSFVGQGGAAPEPPAGLARALAVGPTWTALGPAPIPNGQTATRRDPVSGRVSAIAIHPVNSNTVYAGTANGGVYRTTDGGTNWTPIFDAALSLAIGAIAIAPSDPTTVFVGTGESVGSADSFFGIGVYVIKNADTAPVLTGPLNRDALNNDVFTGRAISKILVHPTNANIIFVSTTAGFGGKGGDPSFFLPNRGLYRSTNVLAATPTFAQLTVATVSSNRNITDMVLDPGNSNNIVCAVQAASGAAGDGGIYRSTTALAAAPTFTQTLPLGTSRIEFAINKVGATVTVLALTGESKGALRRSTDGGATWSTPLLGSTNACGDQCFYDMAVAIHPTDTNIIYIGGNDGTNILRKSTNAGVSFVTLNTGLHADTHVIVLAPSNPTIIYTGNDGGIWKSIDAGTNWSSLNNTNFSATQFESLALHPTDRNFMIGGTQDNGTEFFHPDGTWTHADDGDGGYALIDQNAVDTTTVTMYHTYNNSLNQQVGFARVTNSVAAVPCNWDFLGLQNPQFCASNHITNGLGTNGDTAVLFYAPMALGPGNPNTVYFGTDRLYRSADKGNTMSVVSQGPIAAGVPVSSIGISRQNDNVRIVGLQNGKVFATTTGATVLTDVTGPIPAFFVAKALIDPNHVTTAYVTLGGFGLAPGAHIWKSVNFGAAATWTASGTGIPDVPVNALVVDPNNSSLLYAGTDIGVFQSIDAGATWNVFGMGLPRTPVFDLAIQNKFRLLRAATHGRGIFEVPAGACTLVCSTNVVIDHTSNMGAVVNFAPPVVAGDCAAGIVVTCVPPSGRLFPIGANDVSCTAPDGAGGTLRCGFRVLVLGARVLKTNVLQELVALRATTTNERDLERLDEAITKLQRSLSPSLFIDQDHLDPKRGEKVFHFEKEAVKELLELIEDDDDDSRGEGGLVERRGGDEGDGDGHGDDDDNVVVPSTIDVAVVQGFIDRIVRADRLLAALAINEAQMRGAAPEIIAAAERELAKGDRKLKKGDFEEAIEEYGEAWEDAMATGIVGTACLREGVWRMDCMGQSGTLCAIQCSSDLVNWTTLALRNIGVDGRLAFEDPSAGSVGMRFYRVVVP